MLAKVRSIERGSIIHSLSFEFEFEFEFEFDAAWLLLKMLRSRALKWGGYVALSAALIGASNKISEESFWWRPYASFILQCASFVAGMFGTLDFASFCAEMKMNEEAQERAWNQGDEKSIYGNYSCSLMEVRRGRRIMVLHQRAKVSPSKGTIFFVHGSMARLGQFRAQLDYFIRQGKYDVVAYDYYGCGRSPKDSIKWDDYTTTAHLDDLRSIYNRFLSRSGKNVVVAHSFGCTLAVRLVSGITRSAHAKVPDAVFLLGGGVPDVTKREKMRKLFSLPLWILRFLHPLLSRGFRERALHPDTKDEALLRYCNATSGANPMHVVQPFYAQVVFLTRTDAQLAQKSSSRFFILCGEADKLTPPEKAKELASWIKGAQVRIVNGASHQVMQEKPAVVNAAIEEAL